MRDKEYKNFLLVPVATWGIENSKACPEGRVPSLSQKIKHCQLWDLDTKTKEATRKEHPTYISLLHSTYFVTRL